MASKDPKDPSKDPYPQNPYEFLNVECTAHPDQIEEAYTKMMRKHRSSKNHGGAAEAELDDVLCAGAR